MTYENRIKLLLTVAISRHISTSFEIIIFFFQFQTVESVSSGNAKFSVYTVTGRSLWTVTDLRAVDVRVTKFHWQCSYCLSIPLGMLELSIHSTGNVHTVYPFHWECSYCLSDVKIYETIHEQILFFPLLFFFNSISFLSRSKLLFGQILNL